MGQPPVPAMVREPAAVLIRQSLDRMKLSASDKGGVIGREGMRRQRDRHVIELVVGPIVVPVNASTRLHDC